MSAHFRGLLCALDEVVHGRDGAEAVRGQLDVVDVEFEAFLQPGDDLQQAEAVYDAAGQQVVVSAQLAGGDVGQEFLDDELRDLSDVIHSQSFR